MAAAFPPPPDSSIDFARLGLAVNDLGAGHIESRYSVATGEWSKPVLVQDPMLRLHGLAPALNYGMQAYEGLKAYRSPDNRILLFRPARHAKRMTTSTGAISIPTVPVEHFERCVKLAVAHSAHVVPPAGSGGCLYIRPLALGSGPQVGLTAPTEFLFCVYVQPFGGSYHGANPLDVLVLDDFDRAAPRGTGHAKVGGNYAPVLQHQDRARAAGFPLTLHLDPATRSYVDEFSTSAFLGLRRNADGTITLLQPDSQTVIDSVTADSALELARSFGWSVERRPVAYTELAGLTEVVAAGTAAALVPVRSITRRGAAGDETTRYHSTALFQQLFDAIHKIQMGTGTDPFGWTYAVQSPETYAPKGIDFVASAHPPRASTPVPEDKPKSAVPADKLSLAGFTLGAALVGALSYLTLESWK